MNTSSAGQTSAQTWVSPQCLLATGQRVRFGTPTRVWGMTRVILEKKPYRVLSAMTLATNPSEINEQYDGREDRLVNHPYARKQGISCKPTDETPCTNDGQLDYELDGVGVTR